MGSLPTRWSTKARPTMGGASRGLGRWPLSGSTLPRAGREEQRQDAPLGMVTEPPSKWNPKTRNRVLQTDWNGKLLPTQITAFSPAALCSYEHSCQNCVDAYPTFLVMLWSAGLLCSQVPAAFAGLMYLFVRQKYFVGYLGERTQSTPGYIFGKRIILFLFAMSLAGILNYFFIALFGSDFENYIKTVTTTISPLLLIP
uniref:Arachidonate 5-lipoxygenase-activating protein n=1 Tax=Bos mutus grunniens TaxID=30521 RepID=A0A8B9WUB4_BOSMU